MKRFWRLGLIPALVATLALSACERENADTVATALAESNINAQNTAIAQGTMMPSGEVTPGAEGEGGIAVQPEQPPSTPGAEGYPGAVATPGPEETTVAVPGAEGEAPPATEGEPPPATEGEAGTTEEPAAPAPEGTTTYVVKAGDSLFTIASSLGTTIEQLRALNPALQTSDLIFVGQELIVPAQPGAEAPPAEGEAPPAEPGQPRIHTVQRGEWIYQIARNYGVDPLAIIAANPGINPNRIYEGQQLIIP